MAFEIRFEWDPDENVWVSHVPSLNGLSTFGATYAEAVAMTREAVLGYLEAAADAGIEAILPDSI
ncbi:MAG: type II toxin-antitoxin system HicB family antitoxin [Acidobacteria bacterium]|nr:type II toxin-antitoxin system HicB family antitoxin [Acidobacteriota bacterium]